MRGAVLVIGEVTMPLIATTYFFTTNRTRYRKKFIITSDMIKFFFLIGRVFVLSASNRLMTASTAEAPRVVRMGVYSDVRPTKSPCALVAALSS